VLDKLLPNAFTSSFSMNRVHWDTVLPSNFFVFQELLRFYEERNYIVFNRLSLQLAFSLSQKHPLHRNQLNYSLVFFWMRWKIVQTISTKIPLAQNLCSWRIRVTASSGRGWGLVVPYHPTYLRVHELRHNFH
jgi:hypothetical protein